MFHDRERCSAAMVHRSKNVQAMMQKNYKQYEHGHKLDGFGVYYINLDRSSDRRRFMNDQFHNLDLNSDKVHRLRAVNGKNLPSYSFINKYTWSNYMTNSRIATTLSHLKAIKAAYDNGDNHAIICEDDVSWVFVPLWECTLMEKIEALPADWLIYRLSTMHPKWKGGPFTYYKDHKTYGAQAYVVNRKFMQLVVDNCFTEDGVPILEPLRGTQPPNGKKILLADVFIWLLAKDHVYVSGRPLVFPFNDYGGFNSTISPNFTWNMARCATTTMDRWMSHLRKTSHQKLEHQSE